MPTLNPVLRLLLPLLCLFVATVQRVRSQTIDDRDNINPTAWLVSTGQSFQDIQNTVATGYRIVDIRVDNQFGSSFTVTYVQNTGTYGTAWWYQINVDANTLINFYTQNTARITRLIAWDDGGGGLRFGAVMVPNTGADFKLWWWYAGVSNQAFFDAALANGARPVSIDECRVGTTDYAAGVMIANTGADYRPWWFYFGMSVQDIGTILGQTQARLYSLLRNPGGSFNGIFVQDTVGPWWRWVGISGQDMFDVAGNLGMRVAELQNLGGTYLCLMLRNDNDLERRVGDLMRASSDGFVGVYLKEVYGPVLANLQGGRQFEPASTLKPLLHYHAMDQIRLGNAAFNDPMTVFTGTAGTCPQTTAPVTEPLSTVLRLMMENSDNNRTKAVETRFGRANLNATAQILGMTGTSFNHTFGCGGPVLNRLTLADIGRVYEIVANGALGSYRASFYSLMLQFPDNYAFGELNLVINQEAAAVGLSPSQLTGFRGLCRQAFKGGAYDLLGPTPFYRSGASWISLPFYTSAGVVQREYVTGGFVDEASNATDADTAINHGLAEVLRFEIRAAMTTWRNQVFGNWRSFGTGCLGSNGLRPEHTGYPVIPNVGMTLDWSVANARPSAFSALILGYSDTNYLGYTLPYEMTPIGMPGCRLYTEIFFTLYGATSVDGTRTFSATMPNNSSLIGSHTFCQYAVFDAGANPVGVSWSNALDLLLGGQP